jgi:hypothetical protein
MGSLKVWDGTAWQTVSQQGPAGPGNVLSVDARTGVVTLTDKYLQLIGGTLAEGANIATGTVTGTKIGTAANQRIGFWGVAPAAQNPGWSVSAAYSSVRVFNPNSTTLTEVAKVLATLVDILKGYGLLGA